MENNIFKEVFLFFFPWLSIPHFLSSYSTLRRIPRSCFLAVLKGGRRDGIHCDCVVFWGEKQGLTNMITYDGL